MPLYALTIDAATSGIILGIIAAVVGGIVSIITAFRTKTKVDDISATGVQRDIKLDRIEVLVDGRYSQVLQQLADVKQLLAHATGKTSDQSQADSAQGAADDQAARVNNAPPATLGSSSARFAPNEGKK